MFVQSEKFIEGHHDDTFHNELHSQGDMDGLETLKSMSITSLG